MSEICSLVTNSLYAFSAAKKSGLQRRGLRGADMAAHVTDSRYNAAISLSGPSPLVWRKLCALLEPFPEVKRAISRRDSNKRCHSRDSLTLVLSAESTITIDRHDAPSLRRIGRLQKRAANSSTIRCVTFHRSTSAISAG